MPSDWPQVFFSNRPQIQYPPAAFAPPIATFPPQPMQAPRQTAPGSDKWPELFFAQRVATPPVSVPSAMPVMEAIPAAQKPFQTARIPLPPREELPTITLPKRITVKAPAPPMGPLAPALGPLATPAVSAPVAAPAKVPALKLTNGESVCGTILSETPDAIFLQHEILGVITVPKNAIASRFVEILLHNGDTVAGEWIVDTAQFLVVRSPILGTLTVPRQAIRSIG